MTIETLAPHPEGARYTFRSLVILQPSQAWSGTPATVDPAAVQRFLNRTTRSTALRSRADL